MIAVWIQVSARRQIAKALVKYSSRKSERLPQLKPQPESIFRVAFAGGTQLNVRIIASSRDQPLEWCEARREHYR